MNFYFYTCAVLFFLYGIVIGSFLNVYIYRTPIKESLIRGNSHCTSCNTKILKRDLIPVLSWIFLKGKCRACGAEISIRYPFVELLNGILYLLSFLIFGINSASILSCMVMSVLICLTFIDIDHRIVLDRLIVVIFIIAAIDILAYLKIIPFLSESISNANVYERIIGFFAVSVPIFIIGGITGGMGGGDVKLFAAVGLLLGWKYSLLILLISSITASIFGILIIIKRKNKKSFDVRSELSETSVNDETIAVNASSNLETEAAFSEDDDFEDLSNSETAIPFVPYIAFASVVAMLFGNQIIEFYLGFFM